MSTAINITSCFRDPQSSLMFAFQQKNLQDFKYALENMKADPNVLDKSNEMSIFQSILQTPKSGAFIKLCIENDADCYIKNSITNKYPLHYVIESQCPENLNAFLRNYNPSQMNVKYYHKNCLHILMDMLTLDNYDNISECFKICLINGCDPNLPNEKSRTPFFMLLKEQKKLKDKNELIDFCLLNASIDVYTYKSAEMIKMMESQNRTLPEKSAHTIDADFMLSLLRARKQTEFESNFKAFKESATSKQAKKEDGENVDNNFMEHCSNFLDVAVTCGLANIVELLISNDVDVNKSRVDSGNHVNPPAFKACSYGYSDILELLLKNPELKFQRDMSVRRTLLHEVCMHLNTQESDNCNYLKCFKLLIEDPRCDINAQDYQGNTALHYAVRNKSDVATLALLKKSAYIGTQNMFHEVAIDEINSNVLGRFLDDCITTNTQNRMGDEEHEINIDYTFLMAPKVRNVAVNDVTESTFAEEIAPLSYISKSSDLRPLIKHPVLSSYLYLKWQKLSFLFYANLLVFSIFLVSFITYIVLCQSIPEENKSDSSAYSFFFNVSFLGIIILTTREIFQCFLSFKHYFMDPINWFEIVLICLAWIVLLGPELPAQTTRILRAVTILFVATEFLQLVGTLPILSVSTHMVILKKVSVTFLKSIALYSILLFAFALCFYTMFGGTPESNNNATETASPATDSNGCKTNNDDEASDQFNNFGYPGIAIIKTFVMLTGEFDASSLNLDNASYCIIFVMFVFLITIVLFNLLNALAISDTQIIKNDAELTDLTQRIAVLACYERIIFTNSSRSFCASIPFASKWLKSVISIFPHTILCRIVIRPNQNNEILTPMPNKRTNEKTVGDEELQVLNNNNTLQRLKKQMPMEFKMQRYSTMDAKIMKKIKISMDECNERIEKEMKEEKLSQQIQSMEKQLKMLTDLVIAQNNIKR